jgi:hypothetical protein
MNAYAFDLNYPRREAVWNSNCYGDIGQLLAPSPGGQRPERGCGDQSHET